MMKILYFGRLSDQVGMREESLELPADITNVKALQIWLDDTHGLGGLLCDTTIKIMVDQALIVGDLPLMGTEEIGFLPPVGGG
ncbi:MAG TPA: MoaD/ThiS family protein [Hellea balneolensis]|uniref:MoaD/ThiS family protein n=1 Tax=Hellea balneolensis TaxID=287478 RepID=A0A7C5LS38_9PROT|nr:MoaD/ThiS family protein [Hellea balneolensis]